MNKKHNWVIIILFLIMIFGITIATLFKPDTKFSEKENRDLAQKPKPKIEDIFDGSFSKDYETYLSDQFILRNEWIGLKTMVERATFKQEINGIYFADDGYLIEKHDDSFNTDTAKNNIQILAEFLSRSRQTYGEGHVKAILAPNAVDVLTDKLPPFANPTKEADYLKNVKAALPQSSYVDVESVLKEHKDEEIYYRTDHHWKTLGAFYAYEAWSRQLSFMPVSKEDYDIKTLSGDFLGTIESKVNTQVKADTIEAFFPKNEKPYTLVYNHLEEEVKTNLYVESYLQTKDKYSVYFGGNQPIIEAKIQNNSMRKLLVIKDSYAHCFVPFTYRDFSEVDMVDLRYFNESLKELMEGKDYTDILFLYNVSGFAEDPSVAKLAN